MTYGDLFDQISEELNEYFEALPDEQSISLDDEVEDPEEAVSELCRFLQRKARERENE